MKKVLCVLLALLMLCSVLTACGTAPEEDKKSEEGYTEKETVEETEEEIEKETEEETEKETEEETEEEEEEETEPVVITETSVDVVAVELASTIGLYRQSTGGMPTVQGFEYDAIVVKTLSAKNEIAWLFMTPDQYRSAFNDYTFTKVATLSDLSDLLYICPQQVRVHGTTCDPADYGLSATIGNDTLIEYASHETGYSTVNEMVYENSISPMKNVYTKIVSIDPVMTIFPTTSFYATDVLCYAETDTGEEIYILMSITDYKTHIDSTAELSDRFVDWNNHADAKTFDTPLKLHGISYKAASVISDLPNDIGCNMIFWFKSV